jgi:peptidoglycan hydrolase-like protein with peptidoglycan-binding domain
MPSEAPVSLLPGQLARVELGAEAPEVRCRRMEGTTFELDRSFLIPEQAVAPLRALVANVQQFPTRSILIVGHTDTTGPPAFNLALSRRRGMSTFAVLTGDEAAWLAMFQEENSPTRKWGNREARWMLRFLTDASGAPYFAGTADDEGPASDAAIRRYQTDQGLAVDGDAGEGTHLAMFNSLVGQLQAEGTQVPADRFLESAPAEFWLGCGEQHLTIPTPDEIAKEANRRVEFLQFLTPPSPISCDAYDPDWTRLCAAAELITVEVEILDVHGEPLVTEFFLTTPDGDVIQDVTGSDGVWRSPPDSLPSGRYQLRVANLIVSLVR